MATKIKLYSPPRDTSPTGILHVQYGKTVKNLSKLADHVDNAIHGLGNLISWLNLLMALIVLAVVILRYWFSLGSVALQESVAYLHAAIFMLGISYTLQNDGHVRVDIFYRNFTRRRRAIINLIGMILFLIPTCTLIICSSWGYVLASWAISEKSEEASGIAYVYVLKSLILVMPALLILQGFAGGIRNARYLLEEKPPTKPPKLKNH